MEKRAFQANLSIFKPGETKGDEFIITFFGAELAYLVISLLAAQADEDEETHFISFDEKHPVTIAYITILQEYFPSLSKEILSNELLLREHLVKANRLIEYLQTIGFKNQTHKVALMNAVAFTTSNIPTRLQHILAGESISTKYKFELLRQEVLMLTSLAYAVSRSEQKTIATLHTFHTLFEKNLFVGKYGDFQDYNYYSVHDNQTNDVLHVSDDFSAIPPIDSTTHHFKQHHQTTRVIEGIGPVQVLQREKRTESALIKAIYKGSMQEDQNIDINLVTDSSGFIFVTPLGKNDELLQKLITLISTSLPECKIEYDHSVDSDRAQSKHISFLRIQVYPTETSQYPIELIVFDQSEYLHYLYHVGERQETSSTIYPNAAAHALYELRRSYVAADVLFPQELYQYNEEQKRKQRKKDQDDKAHELLQKNRVEFPTLSQE